MKATRFSQETLQGAEKYHAALLRAFGGEAAARVAIEDLVEDSVMVITLDGINAHSALKCQLLADTHTNKLSLDYGTLPQVNCSVLPSNVQIPFPAPCAFYRENGRSRFKNTDESQVWLTSSMGYSRGASIVVSIYFL